MLVYVFFLKWQLSAILDFKESFIVGQLRIVWLLVNVHQYTKFDAHTFIG